MSRAITGVLARCLFAVAALLAVLVCAPSTAGAAGEPVARWTCAAPGLICDPCPVHCTHPTGKVAMGVPVSFDGRPSSEAGGSVVSWAWDFKDGGTATGALTTHTFAASGVYSVDMSVTDDDGQTDDKTLNIVVAGESLAASASAGVVIGAGTLTDQAAVSGRTTPLPATVDFRLYGPDDALCAGAPVFEQLGVPYPAIGGTVTSAAYTPTQAGTFRWVASFSGDANNPPIPGVCNAANQSVVVSAVTPPPPPPPPPAAQPTCFGKPATIVVSAAADRVIGTPGRDVIVGSSSPDTIDGRGGNDLICAGKGRDKVVGGLGDDKIRGGAGDDDLRGGSGKDRMGGDDGVDRVDGGIGNDDLDDQALGGKGRDRLVGGLGNDRIRTADKTTDSIDCGAGRDSLVKDARDHQKRCERVVSRR